MKSLRAWISIVACLVGASVLGWRSVFQSLPERNELTVFDGTVAAVGKDTRSTRYDSNAYPVVFLTDQIEGFKYLDWFPQPDEFRGKLRPGDRIQLLSDSDRNRWVWEITRGDETIVAYDEILATVSRNNRLDPYLALALGVVGLFGLRRITKSKKRKTEPPASDKGHKWPCLSSIVRRKKS